MLLSTKRNKFHSDWTLSSLFINGVLDGYVVEDEIRQVKVHGETAVDAGTYPLAIRQSPKFSATFIYSDSHNILIEPKEKAKYPNITDWRNHDLIWVKDTPRHQYVLIHWGNTDDDTEGCLIVGSKIGVVKGQEGVIDSRNYYKKFYCKVYPLIKKGGQSIVIS
jgi:hypothetical protein